MACDSDETWEQEILRECAFPKLLFPWRLLHSATVEDQGSACMWCVCVCVCRRKKKYSNNLPHNNATAAATFNWVILPSGWQRDKQIHDHLRGSGSRNLGFFFFPPLEMVLFLLITFLVGGVGGKGNSLQSVFKWMFVPVCDTTLSATSRESLSCYYIWFDCQ